jgi:agmatinase
MVAILGLPFDEYSSFITGSAGAPRRIRDVLHSGESNLSAETGIDLSAEPRLRDLGDLDLTTGLGAFQQIEAVVASLLERDVRVLSLGGDHAITYPILKAYASHYGPVSVLHLDAHPDLYDEFEGSPYSHACTFARIMEERLAGRLVQVGIRTMNPHQRAQAERFDVEVIDMRQWRPGLTVSSDRPVYLSLDMDVLDPAFAPGVSHHEPGGLSTRDLLQFIHGLHGPLVGADIVEFNPERDVAGITAKGAAKLLKEIAALMLSISEDEGRAGYET